MRKILIVLIVLAIMLCAIGCSYQVPKPMTYPDYTFSQTPDTMQLRMTAVHAMRDILSVQWYTEKTISYRKTGPVSGKHFQHDPDTTYAGVLYSNANTGLFQFLEYYNYETGELEFDGTSDELKTAIGTSCADALLWAWSTVCTSISGGFYPTFMIYPNGYIPVGDYQFDFKINTYNLMPTYAIVEDNGPSVIYDAYTKVLPADALVSSSDNHAMMVIETPTVVYTADGSIDAENSYIMIQDQRGGQGTGFFEIKEDGNTLHYSGCISKKYTFQNLYEKHFVPVTTAEFIGTKDYEKAAVTLSKDTISSLGELKDVTIASNYPLAVINISVTDPEGNETLLEKVLFNGTSLNGVPRSYALNQADKLETFQDSDLNKFGNLLRIEVVTSTGERFIPIELKL